MKSRRVLGEIRGAASGPTLVVLAGMHGNEEGGVAIGVDRSLKLHNEITW